jgi:hypothetical protein
MHLSTSAQAPLEMSSRNQVCFLFFFLSFAARVTTHIQRHPSSTDLHVSTLPVPVSSIPFVRFPLCYVGDTQNGQVKLSVIEADETRCGDQHVNKKQKMHTSAKDPAQAAIAVTGSESLISASNEEVHYIYLFLAMSDPFFGREIWIWCYSIGMS